jgi:hypothetical protein
MGIERMPNMMNPLVVISEATKFDTSKDSLTSDTSGPTTSPKPMARNARKIGKVLLRDIAL